MRRYFNIVLGALTMISVALVSAFITMRLAIHGREVEIPRVAGLTVEEARSLSQSMGLNMDLENQFYSTLVPAGRILSQSPLPGTKVRRDWVLRVTASIGPQKVSIPNVVGETEREASVSIRRLALELGTIAYIASPGPSGIVVSQSPSADSAGVESPRVSLLVSESTPAAKSRIATFDESPTSNSDSGLSDSAVDSTAQDSQASSSTSEAYVMPNLVGLTLTAASARVVSMGLKIHSMEVVAAGVRHVGSIASVTSTPAPPNGQPAAIRPIAPIVPITLVDTVVDQKPVAGQRVTAQDAIHITLSH